MRGKRAPKRKIKLDEIYKSELVSKLMNYVMYDGKKATARTIVYAAMDDAGKKLKLDPIEVLEKAVANITPKIEVRSKRVGGHNFQVPVPVTENRQMALSLRWMIEAARNARGSSEFYMALSREIVNAYNKEGTAIKKKEEVLRMAEANKVFTQFA